MSTNAWAQTRLPIPWQEIDTLMPESSEISLDPDSPVIHSDQPLIRMPSYSGVPKLFEVDGQKTSGSTHDSSAGFGLNQDSLGLSPHSFDSLSNQTRMEAPQSSGVQNAYATLGDASDNAVRAIPSFVEQSASPSRIVRYEIPLSDHELNQTFMNRGIEGQLIEIADDTKRGKESISDRVKSFLQPTESWQETKKIRVVRYEVPADDIAFHAQLTEVEGQILEPGMLRLPEVRFFQPKARVFMDLKQGNDSEFDLFQDGAILASLDVVELYFPMPLISERFAEVFGKPDKLSSLGWRVGGTLGLGITTALNSGSTDNGHAPVSTLSGGIRYEFPLGRPSRELMETRDIRLDQRTRVGMEFGLQGGVSTRESLTERADIGLYFGILVNTPWGG
ncbi:hypothetical protein [Planctomycetes bacterium CA13]